MCDMYKNSNAKYKCNSKCLDCRILLSLLTDLLIKQMKDAYEFLLS